MQRVSLRQVLCMTTASRMVFWGGELDKSLQLRERGSASDMVVAAVEVSRPAQIVAWAVVGEIACKEGMVHTGEPCADCDIEEASAAGSSLHCTVACMHCTSAEGIAAAGDGAAVDCKVSSCSYLATCLVLPADDGRSSCRLGEALLPNRPRRGSSWRCAFEVDPVLTCGTSWSGCARVKNASTSKISLGSFSLRSWRTDSQVEVGVVESRGPHELGKRRLLISTKL